MVIAKIENGNVTLYDTNTGASVGCVGCYNLTPENVVIQGDEVYVTLVGGGKIVQNWKTGSGSFTPG